MTLERNRYARFCVRTQVLTLALLLGAALLFPTGNVLAGPARLQSTPNATPTEEQLHGVAADSSTDAWAVGSSSDDSFDTLDSLILHWNGSQWLQVASPNPSSTLNTLDAVRAVSATDVWAVGSYTNDSTGVSNTFVTHWDGLAWSQIPSPSPSSHNNILQAVSGGGSAGGIWAVGTFQNNTTHRANTLILHWNGSAMVRVKSPNPSTENVLLGVRATSSTNAWAVGYAGAQSLVLHWNGSKWGRQASPNPFAGNMLRGANGSAASAWAVGQASKAGTHPTLILRWNGTKWVHVSSPNPSAQFNELNGVQTITPTNAWTVGYYFDPGSVGFVNKTLILHWNGTKWAQVTSPNPSTASNILSGVAGVSSTDLWAVGEYRDTGTDSLESLILHWNGSTWSQV
jgi:hypothetical protein